MSCPRWRTGPGGGGRRAGEGVQALGRVSSPVAPAFHAFSDSEVSPQLSRPESVLLAAEALATLHLPSSVVVTGISRGWELPGWVGPAGRLSSGWALEGGRPGAAPCAWPWVGGLLSPRRPLRRRQVLPQLLVPFPRCFPSPWKGALCNSWPSPGNTLKALLCVRNYSRHRIHDVSKRPLPSAFSRGHRGQSAALHERTPSQPRGRGGAGLGMAGARKAAPWGCLGSGDQDGERGWAMWASGGEQQAGEQVPHGLGTCFSELPFGSAATAGLSHDCPRTRLGPLLSCTSFSNPHVQLVLVLPSHLPGPWGWKCSPCRAGHLASAAFGDGHGRPKPLHPPPSTALPPGPAPCPLAPPVVEPTPSGQSGHIL